MSYDTQDKDELCIKKGITYNDIFIFTKIYITFCIEDFFLAFLPIVVIYILCCLKKTSLPFISLYNNLFVGLTTLNMENLIFLLKDKKSKINNENNNNNRIIPLVAVIMTFISSLIVANITIDEITEQETFLNSFYPISGIFILIWILCFQIKKVYDNIKEEEKND